MVSQERSARRAIVRIVARRRNQWPHQRRVFDRCGCPGWHATESSAGSLVVTLEMSSLLPFVFVCQINEIICIIICKYATVQHLFHFVFLILFLSHSYHVSVFSQIKCTHALLLKFELIGGYYFYSLLQNSIPLLVILKCLLLILKCLLFGEKKKAWLSLSFQS